MNIPNVKLAPALKRVARNVFDIIKQKEKVEDSIKKLEEKYKTLYEEKRAKLQEEYDALESQQKLFENPIKELTGGYGVVDLVKAEKTETGTDKNGKTTYSTHYVLKYPETILPPEPATSTEDVDTAVPYEEPEEESENELPWTDFNGAAN